MSKILVQQESDNELIYLSVTDKKSQHSLILSHVFVHTLEKLEF